MLRLKNFENDITKLSRNVQFLASCKKLLDYSV